MGLRLTKGIDLKIKKYNDAYKFYKNKLKYVKIINNHLIAKNLNLLNLTLKEII
jgi:hypothetical protein